MCFFDDNYQFFIVIFFLIFILKRPTSRSIFNFVTHFFEQFLHISLLPGFSEGVSYIDSTVRRARTGLFNEIAERSIVSSSWGRTKHNRCVNMFYTHPYFLLQI